MGKLRKEGYCVYCGKFGNITAEHAIPQGLFAKPRPNNLITVPCCKNCNGGKSMDDEYLKTVLALRDTTFFHPDVQIIHKEVLRSLNNSNKIQYARYIKKKMMKISLFTKSGIYVGERIGYNVDFSRINRSVEYICRGLYYHEFKKVLSVEINIDTFCTEQLENINPELDLMLINVLKTKKHIIGNDVFTYWFAYDNEKKDCTLWIFSFYKRVHFVALTDPSNRHGHKPVSIV